MYDDAEPVIYVGCPRCGKFEVAPEDLILRWPEQGLPVYSFTCPTCRLVTERTIPDAYARRLVQVGVMPLFVPETPECEMPNRLLLPPSEQEIRDFAVALNMRPRSAWLELYARESGA